MPEIKQEERKKPRWIVIQAVAAVILVGTFLLTLPWASRSGEWTPPLTALFMATSATCVTGHTLVDVGVYFSPFGQVVLLALCQVGGLGFMTLATFLLVLAGRRLSVQSEMTLMSTLGVEEAHEIRILLWRTVFFTLGVEALGALILAVRLAAAHGLPAGTALWHGGFHAVSGFCNAGFTLYPDSLAGLRGDPVILLTMTVLIALGGVGFLVVHDFVRSRAWHPRRARRGRLALHSRIVFWATGILVAGGAALFAILEWHGSLGGLGTADRLVCSLFQSASARTAGFSMADVAQCQPATRFALTLLMFIGGAPGSAAGGIKVTTAVILVGAMLTMIRGRREIVLLGRTITARGVEAALAVFMTATLALVGLYGLLLLTEARNLALPQAGFTPDFLWFDAVSAFGTVGLSTNIMPALTAAGHLVVIAAMFIGRCGPLTVALLVGIKEQRQLLRYPEENVMVG